MSCVCCLGYLERYSSERVWMWNLKEVIVEPDADGGTVIGDITLIAVLYRVISWRMSILSRSFMQHALCNISPLVCVIVRFGLRDAEGACCLVCGHLEARRAQPVSGPFCDLDEELAFLVGARRRTQFIQGRYSDPMVNRRQRSLLAGTHRG